MPLYTKNTGMQSLNELFAMKKNMAFQANFDHTLTSMNKDYYHRRENFNQEMKKVYNDMRDIRISTGYSLDQIRSEDASGPFRNPNPPTIYFPPIGVRLVRKYVGVDIKTGESLDTGKQATDQSTDDTNTNPSTLSKSFQSVMEPDAVRSVIRRMSRLDINDAHTVRAKHQTSEKKHVAFNEANEFIPQKSVDIVITPVPETEEFHGDEAANSNATTESQISDNAIIMNSTSVRLPPISLENTSEHLLERETQIEKETLGVPDRLINLQEEFMTDGDDTDDIDHVFIDTTYNLKDRRSSRSTFRTRSTVRLVSQSSLSEHNMEVVNLSRKTRSGRSTTSSKSREVAQFYLDYGDGKLHDNMKIPNIKDCARPWCNPHCHTCQRRAKKGPCFILIPKKENDRKRQVPTDKRRLSMFPIYRSNSDLSVTSSTDTLGITTVDGQSETSGDHNKTTDHKERTDHENNEEAITNEDDATTTVNKDIETLLQERIRKRRKGYSKKRIDELAQPRGVPPAEVRFSKTSLRRKQEQMKEGERHKAMELERRNQTIIQGKISMFLALLNEQENHMKPPKMVDIPIREDVIFRTRKKTQPRRRSWRMRFNVKMDPKQSMMNKENSS